MPGTAPPRLQRYFALAAGSLRRAGRFGLAERQLMLLPYPGYGNAQRLWLRGRVLAERPFREQQESDSSWRNAAGLYRRLESDEVAGSTVLASFGGQSWRTVTDGGGYFAFEIDLAEAPPPGWLSVTLSMPDSEPALCAEATVLVPDAGARFGIVSDLDDTVIQTNVINKLNMAWTLLRSNEYTRQPFPGVAALYQALHGGINPLFYVSSSPWHLHDALRAFLRLRGLPPGPLLLRALGIKHLLNLGPAADHKLDRIDALFSAYAQLPFVLIGDSGERDPEIYAELVRRHPGRVRVIYIRTVDPDPRRALALSRLQEQTAAAGVELVLVANSDAAAAHAAAAGLFASV